MIYTALTSYGCMPGPRAFYFPERSSSRGALPCKRYIMVCHFLGGKIRNGVRKFHRKIPEKVSISGRTPDMLNYS